MKRIYLRQNVDSTAKEGIEHFDKSEPGQVLWMAIVCLGGIVWSIGSWGGDEAMSWTRGLVAAGKGTLVPVRHAYTEVIGVGTKERRFLGQVGNMAGRNARWYLPERTLFLRTASGFQHTIRQRKTDGGEWKRKQRQRWNLQEHRLLTESGH